MRRSWLEAEAQEAWRKVDLARRSVPWRRRSISGAGYARVGARRERDHLRRRLARGRPLFRAHRCVLQLRPVMGSRSDRWVARFAATIPHDSANAARTGPPP